MVFLALTTLAMYGRSLCRPSASFELPDEFRTLPADMGSFDCGTASPREAVPPLRMTLDICISARRSCPRQLLGVSLGYKSKCSPRGEGCMVEQEQSISSPAVSPPLSGLRRAASAGGRIGAGLRTRANCDRLRGYSFVSRCNLVITPIGPYGWRGWFVCRGVNQVCPSADGRDDGHQTGWTNR